MTAIGSVLLFEHDQSVIKDVTCSLRLIGVPVMTCLSVEEAQDTVQKYRPALVIARFKPGESNSGLALAEQLRGVDASKNIPVYALCSVGDHTDLKQHSDMFNGCFVLPVEFPAFPREVQEIIGVPEGPRRDPNKKSGFRPVPEAQSHQQAIAATAESQSNVDASIRDRNFALAYAIQSKVLRELELDGRLDRAALEQVPGILNQVTAKVCIKYATDKILN